MGGTQYIMNISRRNIIAGGALATIGTGLVSRSLLAMPEAVGDSGSLNQDSRHRNLVETSIDAARSAGAAYADARLSFTDELTAGQPNPGRSQSMTFGVRALVDGYWGFAASPVWSVDEAARLGRAAVQQARANILGKPREVELAPIPSSAERTGHWTMPVKYDPFQMSYEEIYDYLTSLSIYMGRLRIGEFQTRRRMLSCRFIRQDKAFGSSNDQFFTQRIYRSLGGIRFEVESTVGKGGALAVVDEISGAGLGFEYWRDRPIRRYIREAFEEAAAQIQLPVKPVDIGRFNILINQTGMSSLLTQTIGMSTELDRAMGYEANAGSTSYISDPNEMIGTLQIGSPMLSVTADRDEPGALGTVKWDDEGVSPGRFDLVRNGVLVDMQTNREGAGWIKSVYESQGKPFVSHGCAYTSDSILSPMIHSANLSMHPGASTASTLETMRQSMDDGIEFYKPTISMDHQQMTGMAYGSCFEIKNGKRVASYRNAGLIFRTSEIWNGLIDVGGAESIKKYGVSSTKGQPANIGFHAISTPPAVVKELSVIDTLRKG